MPKSSNYQPKTFDIRQPFVAVRRFRSGNREYQFGEYFNWKKLSVAERRVKQLWDLRYIENLDTDMLTRMNQAGVDAKNIKQAEDILYKRDKTTIEEHDSNKNHFTKIANSIETK